MSEYMNLDPDFQSSFEGDVFLRMLPQQELNRAARQTQRAVDSLQGEINETDQTIQSGLSTTGHRTSFNNTGSYFPGR